MRLLISGSEGFIGRYLVQELLAAGHSVIGIDNFSKYGEVTPLQHPNYQFVRADCKIADVLEVWMEGCDQVVALAARIGGISYFHEYAYDLLAENDRIIAATFDAAIRRFRRGTLKKINVVSSSMVYESADVFPTPEGMERKCAPPASTYGFQKLATEYYAQGAWEQFKLPYTIMRPFNCVGIGERRALGSKTVTSGDVKLAMSHVVPDLAQKIAKGQDPLRILGDGMQVRHYTYGGDLAKGMRLCIEKPEAVNEDFNLSTKQSTTVLSLAKEIWDRLRPGKPFRWVSDKAYPHDVRFRCPSTEKARAVLGFEATTTLGEMLDEVVPWVCEQVKVGAI